MADPNAPATDAYLNPANVKVAGKSDLYLADGSQAGTTLYYMGEQIDETPIVHRDYFNDVPGDSNGGPQGPPIERQILGKSISVSFTLSTWSQRIRYWIEEHNDAITDPGTIVDSEVGNLIMLNHCFRVLIVPLRSNPMNDTPTDKSQDFFTFNFPCALLSSPVESGQGTKFSTLRFTMEAFRGPPNHHKRGVLWDRDIAGFSSGAAMKAAERTEAMKAVTPMD